GGVPSDWPSGSNANATGITVNEHDATAEGNQVTVTDPAGKKRRSFRDGVGRLTKVVEDPLGAAWQTNHRYDVLDDLTKVCQGAAFSGDNCGVGGQPRTFSYSSLKRLLSATNPENGTINYTQYDGNGNLREKVFEKTPGVTVTTSYTYDDLNRIKT